MLGETPPRIHLFLSLSLSLPLSTETVALRPLPFPVAPTNDQLQGHEAASFPHPLTPPQFSHNHPEIQKYCFTLLKLVTFSVLSQLL